MNNQARQHPQHHPRHHPQEDLLLSHATCHEHPAVGLLMATHARLCAECREAIDDLEVIGSAFLDGEEEMPVSACARERTLAAIAGSRGTRPPVAAASGAAESGRAELAAKVDFVLSLRQSREKGKWHWRAPGVREVRMPLQWNGIPVTVAQLRSGLHIPQHTHKGRELTLILCGSLTDDRATYAAGDVLDYDSSVSHEQFVGSEEDCLCLVVNESRLVPQTMLGRALA
ncbi:MAG: ChrR family anti-sigma-E factor, partial [Candidatus Binatia bacterium]